MDYGVCAKDLLVVSDEFSDELRTIASELRAKTEWLQSLHPDELMTEVLRATQLPPEIVAVCMLYDSLPISARACAASPDASPDATTCSK